MKVGGCMDAQESKQNSSKVFVTDGWMDIGWMKGY